MKSANKTSSKAQYRLQGASRVSGRPARRDFH